MLNRRIWKNIFSMQGADVKGKPREVCQLGHLPHEHTIFFKSTNILLIMDV